MNLTPIKTYFSDHPGVLQISWRQCGTVVEHGLCAHVSALYVVPDPGLDSALELQQTLEELSEQLVVAYGMDTRVTLTRDSLARSC